MPVVFGVEVGDPDEVDWDWDTELIDTNTGEKVFDLSHQYVPPDQLFASSKDGPCLLSCQSCATVMKIEELIQVKREFHSEVDIDDVFSNMENKYRSEIVPVCYTCVQVMTGTTYSSCPSVFSEVTEAYDYTDNCMPQASDWTGTAVKMEDEDCQERYSNSEVVDKTLQDNSTVKNDPMSVDVENEDSGEKEMNTCDTSGDDVEEQEIMRDDSGVDLLVEEMSIYTCEVCGSEFKTMDEFGKHTRTHDRINARKCPACNVHLSDNKFYDHLKMHGRTIKKSIKEMKIINQKKKMKLKLRKCSLCTWAFQSHSRLKKHQRKVHAKCIFCSEYFLDEELCKEHIVQDKCSMYKKSKEKEVSISHQQKFPCETCQQVLFSQEDLTRHLRMHITYKKCRICSSKIRSGEAFTSHMYQHRMEQKGNSIDSPSLTSAPRCVVSKNVNSFAIDDRNSYKFKSSEQNDNAIILATWRQLSLRMKNKNNSDQGTNGTDISRTNTLNNNGIADSETANTTKIKPVSNSPSKRKQEVGSNNAIINLTNNRQASSDGILTEEMDQPTKKVGRRSTKSSSEKENKTKLPESGEEITLTKKLSLKSNAKKIYFKKSPDILTMLANKEHLQHTVFNQKRADDCAL